MKGSFFGTKRANQGRRIINTMKTLLLTLAILTACTPLFAQPVRARAQANIQGDVEAYDVKGRNGLAWKRKVTYGDFATSRVRGGWRTYHEFPFILTFSRARQRFSYTQYGPDSLRAEYWGVFIHEQTDLPVLGNYFQIPLRYNQYMAGNIFVPSSNSLYEFVLNYPEINTKLTPTEGRIFNKEGFTIHIRGIQRMEQMQFNLPTNLGFEFLIDNEVVAVVDGMVHGRVYFRRDLSDEHKTVLAAVMNGYLLRTY